MDWTVYWFMLPVCIAIAGVAMFSGISGAAMLIPVFLIGFPLLGVPQLTTVEAIGTSLLLETSGFGTGLYRYFRLRLVDISNRVAADRHSRFRSGCSGRFASAQAPVQALRLGYGVAMVGLALLLVREARPAKADVRRRRRPAPWRSRGAGCGAAPGAAFAPTSTPHIPPARSGRRGRSRPPTGRPTCTACTAFAVSSCSPASAPSSPGSSPPVWAKRRCPDWSVAHIFPSRWPRRPRPSSCRHRRRRGAHAHGPARGRWWPSPPSPGTSSSGPCPERYGAVLGTGLQGKVSPRLTRWFFSALFLTIGVTFLLAFTIVDRPFGCSHPHRHRHLRSAHIPRSPISQDLLMVRHRAGGEVSTDAAPPERSRPASRKPVLDTTNGTT